MCVRAGVHSADSMLLVRDRDICGLMPGGGGGGGGGDQHNINCRRIKVNR